MRRDGPVGTSGSVRICPRISPELSPRFPRGGRSFSVGGFDAEGFRASFGEASGVFDVAKKEVRITAPLSALTGAGKVTAGATIDGIEALAQRLAVVLTPIADDAVAAATYKAQAPSCVAVGK